MQAYDPDRLIRQVRDLLSAAGKEPGMVTDERLAMTGACMLLRSLGITPATDPVDAYRQILDSEPWPDTDDRRAAEHAQQASAKKTLYGRPA